MAVGRTTNRRLAERSTIYGGGCQQIIDEWETEPMARNVGIPRGQNVTVAGQRPAFDSMDDNGPIDELIARWEDGLSIPAIMAIVDRDPQAVAPMALSLEQSKKKPRKSLVAKLAKLVDGG